MAIPPAAHIPRFLSAGIERWVVVSVILALVVCGMLSWQHFDHREALNQTAWRLDDLRRARIELANGFLQASLAGQENAPFQFDEGAVLLRQAIASFERTLKALDVRSDVATEFHDAAIEFSDLLEQWARDPERRPQVMVSLRIVYGTLERLVGRVDAEMQRTLEDLADRSDRAFLVALAGSVLALGLIVAIVLLVVRQQRHSLAAQIQAARDLEQERGRLRTLVHTIPDLIWLKDPDGVYLSCNRMFEQVFGAVEAEIVGRTDYDFLPADQADFFRANDRNAVSQGGPTVNEEWVEFASDTHRALLETIKTPMFDPDGRLVGVLGIGRDITRRHLAEAQLHKLSLAVEQSPASILITDRDGIIEYVNAAFLAISGYSRAEAIGRTVRLLDPKIQPPHEVEARRQCLERGGVWSGESVNHRKDGSAYLEFAVISPLRQSDGTVSHFVLVKEDVTEKRRLAEELDRHRHHLEDLVEHRTAELAEAKTAAEAANRAKSVFVANMSHEIRTPLNAVLGLAQIGLRDSGGGRCHDLFGRILESGHSLLGIIEDILDFSKIESGKMTIEAGPFELGAVIDNALRMVAIRAQTQGLTLTVEEADDLPLTIPGDPRRVQQILVNLLGNAVKFTPRGGAVRLEAARGPDQLVFRVRDTGIGIAPEAMTRLFLPFEQADGSTTREYGGTGLGLSISRHLAEAMGGTISVASTPGHGCTFTVTLPWRGEESGGATGTAPIGRAEPIAVTAFGLTAPEVTMLAAHPSEWRVTVAADLPTEGTHPLLIDGGRLRDPDLRAWAVAAARRRLVVVVADPGDSAVAPPVEGGRRIERPVRARHLRAALTDGNQTAEPPMAGLHRLAGLSILAAEDNDVNRLVLEDLLRAEGADLVIVENGRRAVEALERPQAKFDLVVTDIQMPEMDGYALARRVAAMAPDLPVLGLTAHATPEEQARCLEAGMVDRLVKPVGVDALVAAVLRHARRTPATVLDRSRLEARYDGRQDFIRRLLTTVRSTHVMTAADLRAAAATGDLARLSVLAHALKGTAGNLPAPTLERLAASVEQAARDERNEAASQAETLARMVDTLMAELATMTAPTA